MIFARTKLQQMPPSARVWLSSLLLLGVLSMHSAILSDKGGLADQHDTFSAMQRAATAVVAIGDTDTNLVGVPDLSPLQNGESDLSLSDCGGIAMLCLAMIVGASAYIVLRGRAADRVLWLRPPIVDTAFGRPSGPFEVLNPRERSSVLRR